MHMTLPKKDALDRSWNLLSLLEDRSAINITNPMPPREDKEIEEKNNREVSGVFEISNIKIKPNVINTVQG